MNILGVVRHPHNRRRAGEGIRHALRAILPARRPIREVSLPWQVPIRIRVDEKIGRHIWVYGVFDLSLCEALWRLLDPGDFCVDAGANIGQMTGLMACRAGGQGKVLAFEPHPDLCRELRHNVGLFRQRADVAPVEILEAALSDRSGAANLVAGRDFAANRGLAHLDDGCCTGISVKTVTLDEVVKDRSVAVLKLDVEGHELPVLAGARALLSGRRIRHILYESNAGASGPAHNLLRDAGYTLYGIRSWKCGFPILADLAGATSENYLATLDSRETERRFDPSEWLSLGSTVDLAVVRPQITRGCIR